MWYARRFGRRSAYGRKFSRYRRARRVLRRPYARRTRYAKKYRRNNRLTRTTIKRNIVPDITRVKLRSDAYIALDNTNPNAYIYANNSFPDPKQSAGLPVSFALYRQNYSRFVIKACRVKISLVNQSTGLNALYIIPSRSNAPGTGYNLPTAAAPNDQLIAYPNSKRIILPPGSSNAFSFRVATHYMSTQKLFGMKPFNNDTWDADRVIQGVTQAQQEALEDAWHFIFIIKNVDDATAAVTGAINASVEITQYCEFRGRTPNMYQ